MRAPHKGGVEVDTQGDAFFFAFPTAPGALAAAAAIDGGAELGPDPAFGSACTRAHRSWPKRATSATTSIAPLASPPPATAGRCSCRQRPPRSRGRSPLLDLGEHRFKDLAAPERVFQLGEGEFPPLKRLYRTNLPVPTTAIVGPGARARRDRGALQGTAPAADADRPRRHGKDAARDSGGGRGGRVVPRRDLVGVAGSAARRAPARLVARAGARGRGATRTRARCEPDRRLAGRRALFCSTTPSTSCPRSRPRSRGSATAQGPTILVTSRERLQLQGEHVYAVPTLADEDGVELFLTRARALEPAFESLRGRGRALLASRQPAPRARARGRPHRRLLAGAAPRAAFPAARPAQGGP